MRGGGVFCLSLGFGLSIGYLLPEEATRWEAVKLAAAVGFCFAMLLLSYDHHYGDAAHETELAQQQQPSADEPAVGTSCRHVGVQTADLVGLVPLHEVLAKGAKRSSQAQQKKQTKRVKNQAGVDGDGAQFFVD
eukprot:COSAG02_NODE_301_length_25237_cov_19.918490_6_plen_134_part_00